MKTRSGRRQTSAAVALHRPASMSSWIGVQCRAAVLAFSPRVQCTAAALPAPCMIRRADGHLTKLPPTPCNAACTTPKRYAFPEQHALPSAAAQRRGAASPTLPADLRDLAAHPVDAMHALLARARRSRPLASPVAAGYGHTAGEQGSGHGISAQCAAPHRTSRPPSPARARGSCSHETS